MKEQITKEWNAYQALRRSPKYIRYKQIGSVVNGFFIVAVVLVFSRRIHALAMVHSRPEAAERALIFGFLLAGGILIYNLVRIRRLLRNRKEEAIGAQEPAQNPYAAPGDSVENKVDCR